MKKLNLKLFTLAVLLSTVFVFIPPYQSQAISTIAYYQRFFNENKVDTIWVNMDTLSLDPNLIPKIKLAQQAAQTFLEREYLAYDNTVDTLEITTNAPVGWHAGTPPYHPVAIGPYILNPDGTIVPHVVIVPYICVKVVVSIVIAGVTYYFVRVICKGLQKLLSNNEYQITNETETTFFLPPSTKTQPRLMCRLIE